MPNENFTRKGKFYIGVDFDSVKDRLAITVLRKQEDMTVAVAGSMVLPQPTTAEEPEVRRSNLTGDKELGCGWCGKSTHFSHLDPDIWMGQRGPTFEYTCLKCRGRLRVDGRVFPTDAPEGHAYVGRLMRHEFPIAGTKEDWPDPIKTPYARNLDGTVPLDDPLATVEVKRRELRCPHIQEGVPGSKLRCKLEMHHLGIHRYEKKP